MAIAFIHRNRNTTIPHAVARANPRVGGMLRIVERGRLGKLQGGQVFENLGFVAAMRHTTTITNTQKIRRSYAGPRKK